MKPDATLSGWQLIRHIRGHDVLVGIISGDSTGRFRDGTTVRTSALITSRERLREGEVVSTLNTNYLLAEPHGW